MNLTTEIKNKAIEIGFSKIGISKALYYEEDRINLNNWIDNGYNASMQWIENRKEEIFCFLRKPLTDLLLFLFDFPKDNLTAE